MPTRISPQDYFSLQEPTPYIPKWVAILLAIALIGAFTVAIYSISKVK